VGKLIDLRIWWWECDFLFCRKKHADFKDGIFIGPFLTKRKLISWKRAFLRELRILCKENQFELINLPGKTTVFIGDKTGLIEPVRAAWVAEGFYYYDFDEARTSRP
jgi:hypothetical protein